MTEIPPQEVEAGPRMIVFAGPNGSGKSTVTDGLKLDEEFPGVYINADDIARTELGHIPDVTQRNLDAAKLAEQRRKDALDKGQPFAFETVMSTPGKLALLQEAKGKGFQVELVFVTTRDADINIARVSNRVTLGGHQVEPDKVRERYERAMQLLPSAVELADTADAFDNSGTEPVHVAMKRDKALELVNADKAPAWVAERLAEPYRERMDSRAQIAAAFQQATADSTAGLPPVLKDAEIGHGKTYAGPVVEVTKHHALQKAGANVYVVHDRALCPPVSLEKGKTATVAYQYEKGGKHVEPARNAGQKNEIGR